MLEFTEGMDESERDSGVTPYDELLCEMSVSVPISSNLKNIPPTVADGAVR